jgi:diguanylate cyclase (GGDEF)-like protein
MNATGTGADARSVAEYQLRIEELERRLDAAEAENGMLRLQLDVLASVDIVTGLPNVTGMMDVLENALARSIREGEPFGVMSIHIPELATIAERHGRDALKEALRHSGAMIAAGLRQMDTVGRLDDSGFLVTLPMVVDTGIAAVIERVMTMLKAVPLTFDGDEVGFEPVISAVLSSPDQPPQHASAVISQLLTARADATPGSPAVVPRVTD